MFLYGETAVHSRIWQVCELGRLSHDALWLQLLEAIRPLQRGAAAGAEDQQRVEELVKALERQNPNKASLAAPEINGARPRHTAFTWALQQRLSCSDPRDTVIASGVRSNWGPTSWCLTL